MNNNNSNDRGRGRDSRSSDRPQMHPATCSKCGKSCFVPFKPTGNRPIFCSDCFRTEGGSDNRRDDKSRRPSVDRPMYDAICDNCGNRCQIPFPPRPGRKVYCSHCFEQIEKGEQASGINPLIQAQLDAINIKLGKILQLLSAKTDIISQFETGIQEAEKPVKTEKTEETSKTRKSTRKKKLPLKPE